MKRLLFFVFLFCLIAGCKNKKYDPQTYEVKTSVENMSDEEATLVRLHDVCLTFMNYCDENYTDDMKLFVRDWLRTWEGWKTEGVRELGGCTFSHISTKNRYNVKSIHLSYYPDSIPPIFKAELNLFSNEYEDLVTMAKREFGEADEEVIVQRDEGGVIYKWHIDDIKTIYTIPDQWCPCFALEYRLN